MRLLNARTLEVETFLGETTPPYAILSHTWGEDEVSYQDMVNHTAESKLGMIKIKFCCEQALKHNYEYAWVDTCCIDKTSSAELSEAINSMFQWYGQSQVCYVYLADVTAIPSNGNLFKGQMFRSRWFKRGWTLQELLAPKDVQFYNESMKFIGTRATLATKVSTIAGIDRSALSGSYTNLEHYSIAQRMRWAAGRKTTRPEDRAYSLLGIFNVNMTLIYGEGAKAFGRLLRKILKSTNDLSIFASSWRLTSHLLAASPEEFGGCYNLHPDYDTSHMSPEPIKVFGRSIEVTFLASPESDSKGIRLAYTGCYDAKTSLYKCIYIKENQAGRGTFWSRAIERPIPEDGLVADELLSTFKFLRAAAIEPSWKMQRGPRARANLFNPPVVHFKIRSRKKFTMSLLYANTVSSPTGLWDEVSALGPAIGQETLSVSHTQGSNTRFSMLPVGKVEEGKPIPIWILVLNQTGTPGPRPCNAAMLFENRGYAFDRAVSSRLYFVTDQDWLRMLDLDPKNGWNNLLRHRKELPIISAQNSNMPPETRAGYKISLNKVGDADPRNPV